MFPVPIVLVSYSSTIFLLISGNSEPPFPPPAFLLALGSGSAFLGTFSGPFPLDEALITSQPHHGGVTAGTLGFRDDVRILIDSARGLQASPLIAHGLCHC